MANNLLGDLLNTDGLTQPSGIGDLLGGITDTLTNILTPSGGAPVADVVNTISDLLAGTGSADGGLLGNLFENSLTGAGLSDLDGIGLTDGGNAITLDLGGVEIGILPDNGGIVTVDGNGILGGTGDMTDLGGLLGEGGLLNLTGLVGENGLLDLGGLLGQVLDLVGGIDIGVHAGGDGDVDPATFDVTQFGTDGRDTFLVDPAKSTYIDGKGDLDVVNFATSDTGFAFAVGSHAVAFEKGDTLYYFDNVERVKFTEGTLYLDTGAGENAGSAYRLYQAAFDRTPDSEGLAYWIKHLDDKKSDLNAVADSFLHSPEFVRTYGTDQTVSNSQYVDLLYTHTLGRQSDQSGYDYWVNKLDTHQTNRGDLLAFFSESDENQAHVAPSIADGIWLAA